MDNEIEIFKLAARDAVCGLAELNEFVVTVNLKLF